MLNSLLVKYLQGAEFVTLKIEQFQKDFLNQMLQNSQDMERERKRERE